MNELIQFTNENYRMQQADNHDLLMHIGNQNISYAIVDENQVKVLFEADFSNQGKSPLAKRFEQFWLSQPALQTKFKNTKISVETGKFTFVPQQLYTKTELGRYAKYIQAQQPGDVLVNLIHSAEIKNIFAIESTLQEELQKRFQKSNLFSQAEPFITGIYRANSLIEKHLFLNFYSGGFEAAILQNGHLKFYNAFQVENADEFNYFLLNLMQQFHLQETTKISLTGKIGLNDEIYKRIEKYFADISWGKFKQPFDNLPANIPAHTYFSLFSLHLCE